MKYAILNGQKVWRIQDSPSFNAISCSDEVEVGWLFINGKFSPPPGTLSYERKRKIQEINNIRKTKLSYPVYYKNYYFDTTDQSISNLTTLVSGLNAGIVLPVDFTWRSADNVNVIMTKEDLQKLLELMITNTNEVYKQSWELKKQVEQSTTLKALESIVW